MEVTVLKSTGVIRRIDELGRIVIPKEIRRNLKIRDGENIEIFIENDSIILKKYSRIEDSIEYAKNLSFILNNLTNNEVIITDRDHIISACGSMVQNFENEVISKELMTIIDNRETYFTTHETTIDITNEKSLTGYFVIVPIVTSADSVGVVLIHNVENALSECKALARFVASLINSRIDIS